MCSLTKSSAHHRTEQQLSVARAPSSLPTAVALTMKAPGPLVTPRLSHRPASGDGRKRQTFHHLKMHFEYLRNNSSGAERLNLEGWATEGNFSIRQKCPRRGREMADWEKIIAFAEMSLQESRFNREGFATREDLSFQNARFNMRFKIFRWVLEVCSATCRIMVALGARKCCGFFSWYHK